ncbi:MAG: hypothetical protein AABY27_01740 [Pseudomonadota bacterium]
MSFDAEFWVAFSIIFFIALTFKPIKNSIIRILNDKTDSIRQKINEATNLKYEAESLLSEYQNRFRNATNEAKDILKSTEKEIAYMHERAKKELAKKIHYKRLVISTKIKNIESKYLNEYRMKAFSIAIFTTISLLKKKEFKKLNSQIILNSIESVAKPN